MSKKANKIHILNCLSITEDSAKQVLAYAANSKIENKIKQMPFHLKESDWVAELFSEQYQAVFIDAKNYAFLERFKQDINNLNISIFVFSSNINQDEVSNNIFFLQYADTNQNIIDIFLQLCAKRLDSQNKFDDDIILNNISEFIYVKKMPFESKMVSYFSERIENILGYTADDKKLLVNVESIVHPDDIDVFRLNSEEKIIAALHEHKIRFRHKVSNEYIWIQRKIIPQYKNGKIDSVIALCKDISSEIEKNLSIEKNDLYDKLTALPNKSCFLKKIQTIYEQGKHENFVVFCISLDRFKNINDALGHNIGDDVIVEVGQRIQDALKTDDIVARFSGDEFLACSVNVDYLHDATFLADLLIDALNKPFEIAGNEIYLSCSIGVAMNNSTYQDANSIIHDAYQAMYKAKLDVLARYTVYEHEKHNLSGLVSINLESDLRRALKKNELFLEFQPIVSLRDYSINTVEALVRWQHPKKGLLMPEAFIPLAEKTGLIVELGDWVINEAIFSVSNLLNKDDVESIRNVSVNISPIQLGQIDLCERIDQLMVEHQMPSQCIKFEITESVVMDEEHAVNGILSQFRSMGIQLSMDDFGTGFSSLSNLNHLPFNYVKIDKSFVANLYAKGSGKEFINTIIQLAHNMNMEVVAEGVETPEQALVLRNLGCEYAQGYYFSKPVTLARLPAALRRMPKDTHNKQYLA